VDSPCGAPLPTGATFGRRHGSRGIADKAPTTRISGQTPEALPRGIEASASTAPGSGLRLGDGRGANRGLGPGAEKAPYRARLRPPGSLFALALRLGSRGGEPAKGYRRSHAVAARCGRRGVGRPGRISVRSEASASLASLGRSGASWTLERNEAHGRIECRAAGNGGVTRRTRQRSKALKSAIPRVLDEPSSRSRFGVFALGSQRPRHLGGGSPSPSPRAQGRVPRRTSAREGAPSGGRLGRPSPPTPRCRCRGGDVATKPRPASVEHGAARSVTWGSASADRSIIVPRLVPRFRCFAAPCPGPVGGTPRGPPGRASRGGSVPTSSEDGGHGRPYLASAKGGRRHHRPRSVGVGRSVVTAGGQRPQ